MTEPRTYEVPKAWLMFAKMIAEGEYDHIILNNMPRNMVIGDLGGHWGIFTGWALERFPGCKIHAYEPDPENAAGFRRNHGDNDRVTLVEAAVFPTDDTTRTLYHYHHDSGSHTLLPSIKTVTNIDEIRKEIPVAVVHPRDLPQFQLIKLDIEGAEADVVASYLNEHEHLPECIMLEFHKTEPMYDWNAILGRYYDCIKKILYTPYQGVAIWVLKGYCHE